MILITDQLLLLARHCLRLPRNVAIRSEFVVGSILVLCAYAYMRLHVFLTFNACQILVYTGQ